MLVLHRLNRIMQKIHKLYLFILFCLVFSAFGQTKSKILFDSKDSLSKTHVVLGLPYNSDASDDYLIYRTQYVVSYNPKHGGPNWVAWNLSDYWYGETDRYTGNFISDPVILSSMYKVKHKDYTNTGYDRGHVVRSKERSRTEADNKSTFYLTNIIPQTPDLNRGVWLNFEYYCEKLCTENHKQLYVYAGGVYHSNSTLSNKGKVAIPDSCFKIVLILDKNQTVKNVTANTKVIAVMMPNKQGIRKDKWEKYITTVRKIEYSTGYDFFSKIPIEIQNVIENKRFGN